MSKTNEITKEIFVNDLLKAIESSFTELVTTAVWEYFIRLKCINANLRLAFRKSPKLNTHANLKNVFGKAFLQDFYGKVLKLNTVIP